jgi:small subunit ribosomal protein S7
MSRKAKEFKRDRLPDRKYGSPLVKQFINMMMWHGKRTVAERLFYGSLESISTRFNQDGLEIFNQAMENVRPVVEVRSRRVGGATYQVPTEVRQERRDALAIRWIVNAARTRSEKNMQDRLTAELYDASQNRGTAVRKREDAHKMAEANRAFAHYRW